MVYLGPIQPRPVSVKAPSRPTTTTAVTAYAKEQQRGERAALLSPLNGAPGGIERRKEDRRNKNGQPMVETRAGRDRRKAPQTTINISI